MVDSKPYGMSQSHTPRKKGSPLLTLLLATVMIGFGALVAWVVFDDPAEVPPDEWIEHTSAPGNYGIMLPEEPRHETQELVRESLTVDLEVDAVESRHRGYAVAWCDYPPEEVALDDPKEILEGAMQGGIEGMGATLEEKDWIRQGDHPGLEFRATLKIGGRMHYRLYLVGNRLYQLGINHVDSFEPNAELFFGSFELLSES